MYHIYSFRNKVNNRYYIGQSMNDRRKSWHLNKLKNNTHGNKLFQRSYNKHGLINFEYSVLEHDISNEKVDELEIYYIKKYNAFFEWKNGGYNLTSGGRRGGSISQRHKNTNINARKGLKFSKEWCDNISKSRMGQVLVIPKKVYQYDLDGVFIKEWNSIKEVTNNDNTYSTGIRYACAGKRTKICKDHIWFYSYQGSNIPPQRKYKNRNGNVIKIDKYSLEGIFIKTYDSFYDLAKELNITDTSWILKKMKQNGKCYGHIFKFNKYKKMKNEKRK